MQRSDRRGQRVRAMFGIAGLMCACEAGGVGDACVPEEEYIDDFAGFSAEEADAETRSMQCETRVCIVNHFQGRVSCPYGQTEEQSQRDPRCFVPGSQTRIGSEVRPQLLDRRADDAVYCSCRCDGPDKKARYCECPSGFSCEEVIPKLGLTQKEVSGSYCVREGTTYDRIALNASSACDAAKKNCE